jgi:hypothetical protein
MTTANKFYNVLDDFGIDDAISMGQAWYPEAWQYCLDVSKDYAITPQRVAAIVAVTSPRARWSSNMSATYKIVEDSFKPDHQRRASYGILGANVRKGFTVANSHYYSKHVTGPKVGNFYLNIIGHKDPITVDSIMAYAAGFGNDINNTVRAEIENGVRNIAQVFGISNRDAQAAIWIAYRGTPA